MPDLLSLPPELHYQIASYLWLPDLSSFASISSAVSWAISKHLDREIALQERAIELGRCFDDRCWLELLGSVADNEALAYYVESIEDLALYECPYTDRHDYNRELVSNGHDMVKHFLYTCYGEGTRRDTITRIIGRTSHFKWLALGALLQRCHFPNLKSLALLAGPKSNREERQDMWQLFHLMRHDYVDEGGPCQCKLCVGTKNLKTISMRGMPLDYVMHLMAIPSVAEVNIIQPQLESNYHLTVPAPCLGRHRLPLSSAQTVNLLSCTEWEFLDAITRCLRGPCTIRHMPLVLPPDNIDRGHLWQSIFVPQHESAAKIRPVVLVAPRKLLPSSSKLSTAHSYTFVEDPLVSEIPAPLSHRDGARKKYLDFFYADTRRPICL